MGWGAGAGGNLPGMERVREKRGGEGGAERENRAVMGDLIQDLVCVDP